MSATATNLHAFIEDVRRTAPDYLHPLSIMSIHRWPNDAHAYVNIGEEERAVRLIRYASEKIKSEVAWEAYKAGGPLPFDMEAGHGAP